MSTLFLWTLCVVVVLLFGVLIALQRRLRLVRRRQDRYTRRLEEAQTYLQHHIAKLDALVALLAGIYKLGVSGAAPTRDELCRAILGNACKWMNVRAGSLMLLDSDGEALKIVASQGLSLPDASSVELRLGEGIAGRVAQSGKPIYVEDIRTDKRFLRAAQSPLESEAMVSVALHAKDRVLGVLNIHGDVQKGFEDWEIRFLGILADHAALALENFQLYDNMHKSNVELVQTLVHALDTKQAQPRAPASRAAHYAAGVARELELPEQLIQYVEYAVLVRDIGKIGLGDVILQKPGKLTPEEYAVVKKHPEMGSKILSPVASLAPAAAMVRYHREWYNGQGYPSGLSGEEIPLGARIVSVVSAWEAMTAERPYRKALTNEDAIRELSRGAGTQFDPKVVEAFIRFTEKESPQGAPASP